GGRGSDSERAFLSRGSSPALLTRGRGRAPALRMPRAAGQPDRVRGGATAGSLRGEAGRLLRDRWPLWALAALYVALRLALLGALGSYGDYLAPTPPGLLANL